MLELNDPRYESRTGSTRAGVLLERDRQRRRGLGGGTTANFGIKFFVLVFTGRTALAWQHILAAPPPPVIRTAQGP
jgi:hypothetical protein